jgi:hypothetical protein
MSGRPTSVGVVENLMDIGILVFTRYMSLNSSLVATGSKSSGIWSVENPFENIVIIFTYLCAK